MLAVCSFRALWRTFTSLPENSGGIQVRAEPELSPSLQLAEVGRLAIGKPACIMFFRKFG